jgi:hypothetical protein
LSSQLVVKADLTVEADDVGATLIAARGTLRSAVDVFELIQ